MSCQLSGVVEPPEWSPNLVDEAGKVGCDVLEGFVCHQIHGLDLQCLHEALGLGVVVGVSAPAHGAGETMLLQDGAIVFGGILRSTVGMMHATPWWIAGADGGLAVQQQRAVHRSSG